MEVATTRDNCRYCSEFYYPPLRSETGPLARMMRETVTCQWCAQQFLDTRYIVKVNRARRQREAERMANMTWWERILYNLDLIR